MKKAIAMLLVIAMTAALAVGGTLAYLTDTDEDVNVMTVGKVKIDQLEYERVDPETNGDNAVVQEFHDNKPLFPAVIKDGFDWGVTDGVVNWEQIGKEDYTSGIWNPEKINNEVDKMVFVKNKGDFDAYVRTVIAFEAGNYETLDEFRSKVHLNLNETDWTWEWSEPPVTIGGGKYFIATATYNKVLEPGKLTEISLSQIALDPSVTNDDVAGFGDTYQVLVQSQAVQADGFIDADTALTEAFGELITDQVGDAQPPFELIPDDVPFDSDSPIKGIDVRTALHYLDGDTTQPITAKVTNVYFALNEDYPEIAADDGVLVDVEQDVPVYAHYVKNGNNYDVYFLADDVIYCPTNSKELFKSMTALRKVDTAQLDVSRVETMRSLFYKCNVLSEIDTSRWDTSKVTDMYCAFAACPALLELDVSSWDVSKVTDMGYMFWKTSALKTLATDKWDLGNVKNMYATFFGCSALESLGDTGNWDLSGVTTMEAMFDSCTKLKQLNSTNWDLSNVTTLRRTFYNCIGLETLDVSNWNTSNVTSMAHTFQNCTSLTELNLTNWNTGKVQTFASMFSSSSSNAGNMKFSVLDVSNWDTSSATDISYMFYGCGYITELDLSGWDVSNVTTMFHTFADCFKMETYNFSGWDTSHLEIMDGIFNSNRGLKTIDVSDFDTQNVWDFDQLFDGASALQEIIGMNQWDTSSGKDFRQVFTGTKLVVLDLSSFDMSSASYVENMINSNSELTTIYVGDNWNLDPAKLSNSAAMFSGNGKLVGGNGTTYNSSILDATYARVDMPAVLDADGNVITEAVPGYLTHISDMPVNP